MKTLIYFFITNIIAAGALLSALVDHKNIAINYFVAFGIWAIFLWGWSTRMKEADAKKNREQQLEKYIRMKMQDREKY